MAAVEGLRLWDETEQYPDLTADYCRKACGTKRCDKCPAPTLLPCVQPSTIAYGLVRTQWRVGGMGERVGLDYPAAFATWAVHREGLRLPPDSELHVDVMTVEHAMLQADRDRAEADRARRESAGDMGSRDDAT